MDIESIRTEMTPNPNAWKFVLPGKVIAEGNATFRKLDEAEGIPLAEALVRIGHVTQAYFFDNYITITQDGDIQWNLLADVIRTKIHDHFDEHDPASIKADANEALETPDTSAIVAMINEVLDQTVRPALQGDGGDLSVVNFDEPTKTLKINYQGACGSCPSATAGTMFAIQNVLQETVDPEIKVVTV